jgi:hypothetical protein
VEFEVNGRIIRGHHAYEHDNNYVGFRMNIFLENVRKLEYFKSDLETGEFEEGSDVEATNDEETKGVQRVRKHLTTIRIHCKHPIEDFFCQKKNS